jgi:glycosyltransferase involved in cell wall biosynthesis
MAEGNRIGTPGRRSLLIVQPYVPKYREAFFSKLVAKLDDEGISCRVAASMPRGSQSERGDSVEADWIVKYIPKVVPIGRRMLILGGARGLWIHDDAVIVGHLGSSLDTYRAIYDALARKLKVGVWGHIKSYVNDGNPIDLALERWQMRNSDHVFAYTPGGRDVAISAGVSAARITTVMNSTDTTLLSAARDALSDREALSFMEANGLRPRRTLGYIGGLDSSKRIDFLAAALDQLWISDPDIRVLVGGQGADAHVLSVAQARGQVLMMGYASVADQALIGRVCSALVIPGRIGLVAVDALVLGIPILTTAWNYHAPESEFLCEGESRFTSADNPSAYAALIRNFLDATVAERFPSSNPKWTHPTIDMMVDNFGSGVLKMLSNSRG